MRVLEEVVRGLESLKADPDEIGALRFDDARLDGHVATALSAARAALSIAAGQAPPNGSPGSDSPTNPGRTPRRRLC